MSRKIAITIDTEAFPVRAEEDYVNRLIYGAYAGRRFGIPLMMDIAEKYNIQLTFFLDLPEYYMHGEELLDVGRYILKRGHDVQPHMHMDPFTEAFWNKHGLSRIRNYASLPVDTYPEMFSREHLRCALLTVMELYGQIASEKPSAFRSVGYILTPLLVELLGETGIPISCNYNAALPDRAQLLSGLRKPFRWHTGMVELPVACLDIPPKHNLRQCKASPLSWLHKAFHWYTGMVKQPAACLDVPPKKYFRQYNFNLKTLLGGTPEECAEHHKRYLDSFFSFYGEDAIAVMVLHSWSFFRMDEKGYFSILDERAPEKFEAVLRALSPNMEFITTKDIARNLDTLLPDLPVRPADPPDRAKALSCYLPRV